MSSLGALGRGGGWCSAGSCPGAVQRPRALLRCCNPLRGKSCGRAGVRPGDFTAAACGVRVRPQVAGLVALVSRPPPPPERGKGATPAWRSRSDSFDGMARSGRSTPRDSRCAGRLGLGSRARAAHVPASLSASGLPPWRNRHALAPPPWQRRAWRSRAAKRRPRAARAAQARVAHGPAGGAGQHLGVHAAAGGAGPLQVLHAGARVHPACTPLAGPAARETAGACAAATRHTPLVCALARPPCVQALDAQPDSYSLDDFISGSARAMLGVFPKVRCPSSSPRPSAALPLLHGAPLPLVGQCCVPPQQHTLRLPLCCETPDTPGSWAPAPPSCPNRCKIPHHTSWRGAAQVHHASFCLVNAARTSVNMYTIIGEGSQKAPRLNVAVAPSTLIYHVLNNYQPLFISNIPTFSGSCALAMVRVEQRARRKGLPTGS